VWRSSVPRQLDEEIELIYLFPGEFRLHMTSSQILPIWRPRQSPAASRVVNADLLHKQTHIHSVGDVNPDMPLLSAVIPKRERELVLRLASLLWRLRRATAIETGLFEVQADQLKARRSARHVQPETQQLVYAVFKRTEQTVSVASDRDPRSQSLTNHAHGSSGSAPRSAYPTVDPTVELARCFSRLANLPNFALDRLSRYEATLWRQARQALFALDALDRRKPQERGPRFPFGPSWLGSFEGDDS
jgi:hypothetical protein